VLVNDVHSRLDETVVDEIVPVGSLEDVRAALDRAHASGKPVSIAGGRHAMGGQKFWQAVSSSIPGFAADRRGLPLR
jgi:hypothetical protein